MKHEEIPDQRPELRLNLPEDHFRSYYWLKSELIHFLKINREPYGGSKSDLIERIAALLSGRNSTSNAPALSRDMAPTNFSIETVVVPGFKLSARLRSFFIEHEGQKFRFNQALRDFFKTPNEQTLGDALELYRLTRNIPTDFIQPQFQYNQHMRSFFNKHPKATLADARADWWHKSRSSKVIK